MDILSTFNRVKVETQSRYRARLAGLREEDLVYNLANRIISAEAGGERWGEERIYNRRNVLLAEIKTQIGGIPTDKQKDELINRIVAADKAYAQDPQKV